MLKQAIEVPALTGGEFMVSGLYVFRARKYDAPLADIMEHPVPARRKKRASRS